MMKVSDRGLVEIAAHEGIVPAPYRDSVGVWTWGVGHTEAAGAPIPADMPRGMPSNVDATVVEALRVFGVDLGKYEARVREAIMVPLEQHEFDALVSFDFNTGGIFKAKLTKAINAGDPNAGDHFMGWLKPPEIRGRRTEEMNLFKTGVYSAGSVPIWKVDENGKLRGIHSNISADDLLTRMRGPAANYAPKATGIKGGGLWAAIKAFLEALTGGKKK